MKQRFPTPSHSFDLSETLSLDISTCASSGPLEDLRRTVPVVDWRPDQLPQGHHQDWRDSLQSPSWAPTDRRSGHTKTWPLPDSTDSIPGAKRAKRCRLTAEPREPGLRGSCWEMDPMILGDTRQGAKIQWTARCGEIGGQSTDHRGSQEVLQDVRQASILGAWLVAVSSHARSVRHLRRDSHMELFTSE